MLKLIKSPQKPLNGSIVIPADKSVSHRAIMFSSLGTGICTVRNFLNSDDCISTVEIFKNLGVDITFCNENTLLIKSDGHLVSSSDVFHCICNNSGTTMRLMAGILAGQNFNSKLVGDDSLSKRPMRRVTEPLSLMGANISATDGHAPMYIEGKMLHGINYCSNIASAQVKSCVLLAGLGASDETVYSEPYKSRNHTEILLKYLGADLEENDLNIKIRPSSLINKDIDVVGDISSAAFFIVAGLIVQGSDITIKNVGLNETRSGIIDVVKKMGGNIEILNQRIVSGEPVGDIRVLYSENLKPCIIQGADIPRLIDELPIIAVLASQANGVTVVKNAEDLRNKESDRIKCLVNELSKIGVNIKETSDGFRIEGEENKLLALNIPDSSLKSYADHRLAMSFYVAGLVCKHEICIEDFNCIKISFPNFENLMLSLFDM